MEGPLRAPERLALVMPLLSVICLTLVVAAAATGQSTFFVAMLAAVGFAVCALTPMLMLELYMGRPLRAALAHLRAARDGLVPPGVAPAGVIGDLVAAARDIAASQASAGQMRAALAQWERMAVAGDETIRAVRRCEEWAQASGQDERQWRRFAQAQFVEISDAMKAATPAASLETAMTRIEQLLVYLADAAEQRDGWDHGEDEGIGRVERTLTDMIRLIGRETQTVRDEIAATLAEDRDAQGRRVERLEAAILTKLDTARYFEAQAPQYALSGGLDPLSRVQPAPEAFISEVAMLIEQVREQTRTQASRLSEIETNLARKIAEGDEDKTRATLARTTEKLRNAIDRLDVLSASAATFAAMQNDDLGGALRALGSEVAGMGAKIDAGACAFEERASELTLAVGVEAQTLAALRADVGSVKARVAEIAPRLAAAAEALTRRLAERLDGGNREAA